MANRYIRDTVVLAKIETTYGTDAVPAGAQAMLVSNVRITPINANYVSRALIRPFFGASEQLISTFNKLVSFDVEAVGAGTAGTPPAWGPLLRACGFAETATATTVVSYKPITNSQEAITLYVYDSGVLHKFLGARGGVSFDMGLGGIPKMTFSFVAVDGGDTAGTPAGMVYTGFQQPQVVADQFTGSLTLGGTLSAANVAPSITGGQVYPSKGLTADMGIKATYIPLLDGQSVEITDRQASGKITVDATAAQEIALAGNVTQGTLQTLALIHGTVVGRKFGLMFPAAQLTNPQKDEQDGKRLLSYDCTFTPSAGNDEVTVVTSF